MSDKIEINDLVTYKHPMEDEANDIFTVTSINENNSIIKMRLCVMHEKLYDEVSCNSNELEIIAKFK